MKPIPFDRWMRRQILLGALAAAVILATVCALAFHFMKPAPPERLVMTTDGLDAGAHSFAQRYQTFLAHNGVELELRPSQGSPENLARLMDPNSEVDAGFIQAGTAYAANTPGLVSLGSLYYQPLWVFYRGPKIDDLAGLRGKRIAIGPNESGTRALALQLLAVNNVVLPPTELIPQTGKRAADMLLAGEVDAAMYVEPAESATVQRLISEPGVRLLSFDRAEAYTRRFPYLTKVVLPKGVVDFVQNTPSEDIVLIAPTENLLVREQLHPALAYLLMRAATEINGSAGMFNKAGEFPSMKDADFPFSPEAKRYYTSGPPFLQRYLPFWAANLVDRLWVVLLPTLAVLIPLSRALPALYRWRMQSRIYTRYGQLKMIELELESTRTPEELAAMLENLDDIEDAVNHIRTPLAFSQLQYSFRQHIDLVRRRVQQRRAGLAHDDRRAGRVDRRLTAE